MSDALRLIITNSLALVAFLLMLYTSIMSKKEGMLWMKSVRTVVMCLMYIVGGLFSALATSIFVIIRNLAIIKMEHGSRAQKAVLAVTIAGGTILSTVIAYQSGNDWSSYLPTISFLTYSVVLTVAKSAKQVRILDGLDVILFWLPFNFVNQLVACVVSDLFLVLIPFAEKYVEADKELA